MNNEKSQYSSNYPRQILRDIKKLNKQGTVSTFSIDALFGYSPLPENPLELFNAFSVFNLTIIQNKNAITGNMKVSELSSIKKLSELIYELDFKNKYHRYFKQGYDIEQTTQDLSLKDRQNNASDTDPKLAFQETLTFGKFKGRTPGDAMLNDTDAETELMRNRQLLAQNLAKYPRNENVILSIDAAIRLSKMGALKGEMSTNAEPSTLPPIMICDGNWKNKTGKANTKVISGTTYHRCYRIRIAYNPQRNTFPVTVSLENQFMPVQKLPDGRQNILASQGLKDTYLQAVHSFSLDEWLNVIADMEQAKERFAAMVYPTMYKKAVDCDNENRMKGSN